MALYRTACRPNTQDREHIQEDTETYCREAFFTLLLSFFLYINKSFFKFSSLCRLHMNKRVGGVESKLRVRVDAVGSGVGIYKSTAGVMERQPDVYA